MASGTSIGPAGMRRHQPRKPPASAMVAVARKGNESGTSGLDGGGAPLVPPKTSRETSDALRATMMTRRYCMKATSLGSAPYSSAMATIADAAPGDEPQ